MIDATYRPPRPVKDATIHERDLTGYLFAWNGAAPLLIALNGTDDLFLPIFQDLPSLVELADSMGLSVTEIKQIDRPKEFLQSLPFRLPSSARLRVIANVWVTEDGNTRFTEIIRDEMLD